MKKLLICFLLASALALSGCSTITGLLRDTLRPTPEVEPATAEPTPTPAGTAPPTATPSPEARPKSTAQPSSEVQPSSPPSSYTREEALEFLIEEDAPDFTLELLSGEEVSLSDYRGKIVFLSFWQTWCGPCRNEMPHFEAMMRENEDVVVLAVNPLPGEGSSKETAEKDVRAFIEKEGFTFPVLLDRDGSVFGKEVYRSQYIPANYVIDREGILRIAMEGSFSEDALATVLDIMRGLDW